MTAVAGAFHIRPAVEADLAAMVAIERASFSDPWTASAIASTLRYDHMRVLVAEERGELGGDGAGRPLGYVVAMIAGPEAEIADLAVSPAARRRGIGRALIDRLLGDLATEGVLAVFLEVRESNHAARTLYESRAFQGIGRRRGYYRLPPEDALILKRELGPA
ncbi:MAG TPA: ribosomal protein S18-alanine N-acetyltransferase [Gemmatimonadaceae bacterium]